VVTVRGTITYDFVTRDGQVHPRDIRANGTVTSDGGAIPVTEPLRALPGPFGYECAGDSLTLNLSDGRRVELKRD
jgi:hypothetical protein